MHHRIFHYMDSDINLNNNNKVTLLIRMISQTVVTIHDYPPFTYFHKPNNERMGPKHVAVLHRNLFCNKTTCGSPRNHSWCPRAA